MGLERLIAIPSVSLPGFAPSNLQASAAASAEILSASGFGNVDVLQVGAAHPAVFGSCPTPAGQPRVLLYAHHDVQPAGDPGAWMTPPFEATGRNGRLYGRGTADDKAAIAVHAAVAAAFDGRPPVGLSVFVEGEEELMSPHLSEFVERYEGQLRADVIVLLDGGNLQPGQPTLTTSLRGLVDCVVEIRTLAEGVHSGEYGGALPDAASALVRILSTLHDDQGQVAVEGLVSGQTDSRSLDEGEWLRSVQPVKGLRFMGKGTVADRVWSNPAVSVLGLDAPAVNDAGNQLVPSARAKISLRLAPGDEPGRAMQALVRHLERNAPWGAEIRIEPGAVVGPFQSSHRDDWALNVARAALRDAWGVGPVDVGSGGSIGAASVLAKAFPEAAIVITGIADLESRAHSVDESISLKDYECACLAEGLLLLGLVDS